ncbi:MAG: chromosome segregation protein SMC [bacterium]
MYLKGLSLYGFKTFAAKMNFIFLPGVTAIVGPNGSGKSNLFDAIVWVSGEHNIRSIRGRKMEEVVFHGSGSRKPLGYAQVELTFDNEDGFFPLPHSEVSITRRYYRSGESEFLINNEPCRLRDIQSMLLDTGLGKLNYSIVSQGDVEYIINLAPIERRTIFDEAAGINKYKIEKRKTLQKIKDTETNIARITDIVTEIEERLEPLAAQAEKARRYEEITTELEALKMKVLASDITRCHENLKQIDDEEKMCRQNISASLNACAEQRREKDALQHLILETQSAAEQAQREQNQLVQQIARLEEAEKFSTRIVDSLQQQIETDHNRLTAEDERKKQTAAKIGKIENQIQQAEDAVREMEAEEISIRESVYSKTATDEKPASKADLMELRVRVRNLKEKEVEFKKERDSLRLNADSLEETIAEKEQAKRALAENIAAFKKEQTAAEAEQKKLSGKIQEIERQIAAMEADLSGEKEKLGGIASRARQKLDELQNLKTDAGVVHARLRDVRKRSAADTSPREWLTMNEAVAEMPKLKEIIRIRQGADKIVHRILDALLELPVIADTHKVEAIRPLPEKEISFILLTDDDLPDDKQIEGIRKTRGVVGFLADFIELQPDAPQSVLSMLYHTIILEDHESLLRLVKEAGTNFACVSRDGALSLDRFVLTIGNPQPSSAELESELENLQRSVKKTGEEINRIEEEKESAEKAFYALRDEKSKREDELRDLRFKQVQLSARSQNLNEKITGAQEEIKKIETFLSNTVKNIGSIRLNAQQKDESVLSVISELRAAEVELVSLEETLAGRTDADTKKEAYHLDLKMRIREKKNSLAALQETLQLNAAEKERIQDDLDRIHSELARLQQEKENETGRIENIRAELDDLNRRLEEAIAHFNEKMEYLHANREKVAEIDKGIEDHRQSEEQMRAALLQLEVKRARAETMLDELRKTIEEEYPEFTEEELVQKAEEVKHGDKARFRELKAEREALMPVNQLAIEEYEEAKNRHDFLAAQLTDLNSTRQQLLEMIDYFDEKCRDDFITTFQQINQKFQETFVEIFGGGESRIFLTNEDEPLESGVEISVQIPGKRMRSLQLLSGGEKALCALTLIFAILKVKPSPFYLLDEVDAGLDEQNIQKFKMMLAKYSKDAQFFIITHNKGTLEGADHLYGITMEEEGVSKVLSVSLE